MANMPNDFWSGWIIVLTVFSFVVMTWSIFSIYFSRKAKAADKAIEENEPVWDEDLREGHAAPPMWWFWFILGTCVFTVVYLMMYPGLGKYKGAMEWSQDSRVESKYANFEERFADVRETIAASTLSELQANEKHMLAAEGIFSRNCAMCHGEDAMGQASLFPNLMDGEWQWGGSAEAIEKTIREGRTANMIAWRGVLNGESIDQVANYVATMGKGALHGHPGEATFGQYCASCHGADGRGNEMLGAPNLANDEWLYGGDLNAIKTTIVRGRNGEMPGFEERLDDVQIKLLVAWLTRDLMLDKRVAKQ